MNRPRVRGIDDGQIPPALRVLLVEWRRVRIVEANAISDMLGMPRVKVDRKDDPKEPCNNT